MQLLAASFGAQRQRYRVHNLRMDTFRNFSGSYGKVDVEADQHSNRASTYEEQNRIGMLVACLTCRFFFLLGQLATSDHDESRHKRLNEYTRRLTSQQKRNHSWLGAQWHGEPSKSSDYG